MLSFSHGGTEVTENKDQNTGLFIPSGEGQQQLLMKECPEGWVKDDKN